VKKSRSYLGVFVCLALIGCTGVSSADLEAGFQSPPDSARPMTWWHWMNGNISKEGITRDLEAMNAVGIGGVQFFDVGDAGRGIPRGPVDYASDAWYEMVSYARQEAERLGMDISIHNGCGWSNTGGPWVTPELSMKTVVWTEQQVQGGGVQNLTLKQPETKLNFYRDIAVLAFPTPADELSGPLPTPLSVKRARGPEDENVPGGPFRLRWWTMKSGASGGKHYRIPYDRREAPAGAVIPLDKVVDLTAMKDPNGNGLTWDVPAGNWTVVRFGYTTTGHQNVASSPPGRGLEIDKFDKAAADFHWNHLIQRAIDNDAGQPLSGVLIDSYEVQHQNWTEAFPAEFEQRCGYSILPWLPCVTGRVVGDVKKSERFLWDYRKTQSALQGENYFGRFAELCHQNNMKLYIEPYGSGMFDSFEVARIAGIPLGEFWIDRTVWRGTSKLVSSASHLDGEKIVAAESFTSGGKTSWKDTPYSIKAIGDLYFTHGITRYYYHTSAHQPWNETVVPGVSMGRNGIQMHRNNGWFSSAGAYFEYVARCQYLLKQGDFVADFLYAYPASPKNMNEERHRIKPVPAAGYDYDVTNLDVLSELKVCNGRIVHASGMSYRVLVIPESHYSVSWQRFLNDKENGFPGYKGNEPRMELETLKQLKRLADAGAVILAQRPVATLSLHDYQKNDAALRQITDALWGQKKVRALSELDSVIAELKMQPDFEAGAEDLPYIHRRTKDGEIYFVSNQENSTRQVSPRFRASGKLPELWNPLTGETQKADNWKILPDGRTEVQFELGPVDSMFVVFRQPTQSTGESTPPKTWREVASVSEPWTASFNRMGPETPIRLEKLMPLNEHSEEEVKYFAGLATYKTSIDLPASAFESGKSMKLDLGQVAIIAGVRLNGVDLGSAWKPPYQLDIGPAAKPGQNELEVSVATLMCNRLIGDERYPEFEGAPKGHNTTTPEWLTQGKPLPETSQRKTLATHPHATRDDPLMPAGLIGPVVILVEGKPVASPFASTETDRKQ